MVLFIMGEIAACALILFVLAGIVFVICGFGYFVQKAVAVSVQAILGWTFRSPALRPFVVEIQ